MQAVDGPAKGVTLSTRRCPQYLRLVKDATGKWDALDQPEDTPTTAEVVFAYRLVPGTWSFAFIDFRDGKGKDGRYESGRYEHLPTFDQKAIRTRDGWKQSIANHLGLRVEDLPDGDGRP